MNLPELNLSTSQEIELINITQEVEEIIGKSQVKSGCCIVFTPHATASLICNEDEPNIRQDFLNHFKQMVPGDRDYLHNQIDNNARSHIMASLLPNSLTFIIEQGQIIRGTWQEIFFVELDGPRNSRKVLVKLVKD